MSLLKRVEKQYKRPNPSVREDKLFLEVLNEGLAGTERPCEIKHVAKLGHRALCGYSHVFDFREIRNQIAGLYEGCIVRAGALEDDRLAAHIFRDLSSVASWMDEHTIPEDWWRETRKDVQEVVIRAIDDDPAYVLRAINQFGMWSLGRARRRGLQNVATLDGMKEALEYLSILCPLVEKESIVEQSRYIGARIEAALTRGTYIKRR